MEGRAETPEQKREILDQLYLLWCQYPNWRLGQLICNAMELQRGKSVFAVFNIEDQALIESIMTMIRSHREELDGSRKSQSPREGT